jgi:hypothetical protein
MRGAPRARLSYSHFCISMLLTSNRELSSCPEMLVNWLLVE